MLLRPALLVLSAISLSAALVPPGGGSEVLTAPPAFEPTAAPAPAPELSFTLSCWCETIPILTTTFCLPCSTIFFTNTDTTTAPAATATE
ncbi:hypothetical protein C8R44DRAFT_865767 [Mycena epipterygia]|nr:hypothetical protein C8R44DRAFT_865767 [Mycena epipterygia]